MMSIFPHSDRDLGVFLMAQYVAVSPAVQSWFQVRRVPFTAISRAYSNYESFPIGSPGGNESLVAMDIVSVSCILSGLILITSYSLRIASLLRSGGGMFVKARTERLRPLLVSPCSWNWDLFRGSRYLRFLSGWDFVGLDVYLYPTSQFA